MIEEDRRKTGAMERHAQTVALGLITAILVWVGATLREMYDSQIEQRQAIDGIREQMADIKTEVKDVRDKLAQLPTQREIDARFDALNRRVEALESRR
jgi:vacuolar-type H+-ATPase subunit I/STV1